MIVAPADLMELADLELSPKQLRGVLTMLARMQSAEDERRTKQRERKARSRDKSVTVAGQERDRSGDEAVQTFPDKEKSPEPSKENNPSSPSLRSGSESARSSNDDDLEIPPALRRDKAGIEHRREFAETFWPEYPNKVAKPFAEKAFLRARQRVSLEQIMAGLERYLRTKPATREWQNPATFLNQERFNDEPAPNAQAPPPRSQNGFARLALEMMEEDRVANRQNGTEAPGHAGPGQPDQSADAPGVLDAERSGDADGTFTVPDGRRARAH